MRTLSLWILAAAAVLAAVFALLGDRDRRGPSALPGQASEPATSDLAQSTGERTPAVEERAGPAPPGAADSALAEPRSTASASEPLGYLDVLTVDAVSGEPLAGVEVRYGRADASARARRPAEGDATVLLESLQRPPIGRTQSDGRGIARVPLERPASILIARKGPLYAALRVDRTAAERRPLPTLRLALDWDLRVVCVNERGAPASGVPLALALPARSADGAGLPGQHATPPGGAPPTGIHPIGRSGHSGILTLRHAQRLVGSDASDGRPSLFVDRPGAEHLGVSLDPSDPPLAPVRIVVPDSGQIRARVRDASGEARAEVAVGLALGGDGLDPSGRASRLVHATDGQGEALFEGVAVGRTFRLDASTPSGGVDVVVPGPRVAGETVDVALDVGLAQVVLRGRAYDDQGHALVGERLRLTGQPLGGRAMLTRTREGGWFHLELPVSTVDAALEQLELTWIQDGSMTTVGASLPRGRLRRGENEVGQVTFGQMPILLAGRIEGAAPDLHDVRVAVETWSAGGAEDEGVWTRAQSVALFPLGQGRFEMRCATLDDEVLRLHVAGAHYLPIEPIPFLPGQLELEVALERGGTLHAAVSTRRAVRVQLSGPGGAAPVTRELAPNTGDGARVLGWFGLPGGIYRLTVHAAASDELLVELDGLAVPFGQACDDPRLSEVRVP